MKAAAVGLALLLAAGPSAAQPLFQPASVVGIDGEAGVQAPLDAPLVDADGRPTTLREIAGGKPILLAPVLHDCPNICGVTLTGLAQAIAVQPYRAGTDFAVVAFGIDPAETPGEARASLEALAARFPELAGEVDAVTAPAESIAAVTGALGFRYAWDDGIEQYAHAAAIAVLTPDGRLARWLFGVAPEPTSLRLALTEAGEGRIGDIGERLLLLCYRYDPQTGRYGSLIWGLLRAGGIGTVAAVGAFVGVSLLRDRRRRGRRRR
ncbi:MAG: SCO family protein [Alphaproteobacteria bacterium]